MVGTGQPIVPRRCLDETSPSGSESNQVDSIQVPQQKEAKPVRCAGCLGRLTDEDAAIEVTGQHTHMCMNPHGLFFRVACFTAAPGCTVHGQPEEHWSWFTGYGWQIAACGGCSTHLGWRFTAGDHVFFGLIDDRILRGSLAN